MAYGYEPDNEGPAALAALKARIKKGNGGTREHIRAIHPEDYTVQAMKPLDFCPLKLPDPQTDPAAPSSVWAPLLSRLLLTDRCAWRRRQKFAGHDRGRRNGNRPVPAA